MFLPYCIYYVTKQLIKICTWYRRKFTIYNCIRNIITVQPLLSWTLCPSPRASGYMGGEITNVTIFVRNPATNLISLKLLIIYPLDQQLSRAIFRKISLPKYLWEGVYCVYCFLCEGLDCDFLE